MIMPYVFLMLLKAGKQYLMIFLTIFALISAILNQFIRYDPLE